MNKKKIIKDILFIFFLIILLVLQYLIIINYNKKNSISLYSNVAKWSFVSNNSETAIKLSDEKIYPGSERKF